MSSRRTNKILILRFAERDHLIIHNFCGIFCVCSLYVVIVPCAGDMFLTFDSIVCEPVNKTIKNSNAVHMAIRIFVWLLSLAMLLTMFQSILSFSLTIFINF